MRCATFLLRPAVVAGTLATLAACAADSPRVWSESASTVASLPALPALDTLPWRLERPAAWDNRVREVDGQEGPQHLPDIFVYAEDARAKLTEQDCPPQGDALDRRAGLVYVAGLPQANPLAAGSADSDEFQQRELALDTVRAGFRVVH